MTLCGGQRMIADNCCRKSSNRRLAPVVATGEPAGVGQKRRFDHRPVASGLPRQTDVFRDRQHVSNVPMHRNRRSIVHRREPVFTLTTIENGHAACPRFSSDACRIRPSCRPPGDDKKVGQCSMLILKGHLKTFIFSAKCPYRSRAEVRIAAQTRRCQSRP